MKARYQINRIYITVTRPVYLGEILQLREDLRGTKMGYPLFFQFVRNLSDGSALILPRFFFLIFIALSFWRNMLPLYNSDELLVIKAF